MNTVFKMAISFPGSLKAKQDANFARFTTQALLPIFPEESWVLKWIRIRFGYVWTGKFDLNTIRVDVDIFESGKKKLRIQKYPDTCGRGLRWVIKWNGSDIARYAVFFKLGFSALPVRSAVYHSNHVTLTDLKPQWVNNNKKIVHD